MCPSREPMQDTPRRSTRALFAPKTGGDPAATPGGAGLDMDAVGSPSTTFGFPTSAQQSRFRRGALFASGAGSAGAGTAAGAPREGTEQQATIATAYRGAARVIRRGNTAAPGGPGNCEVQERSGGARCVWCRVDGVPGTVNGGLTVLPSLQRRATHAGHCARTVERVRATAPCREVPPCADAPCAGLTLLRNSDTTHTACTRCRTDDLRPRAPAAARAQPQHDRRRTRGALNVGATHPVCGPC